MVHAGCGAVVEYVMCSHVSVQSGVAVVFTLSLPTRSVGRLRVTLVKSCAMCPGQEGVTLEASFLGLVG